MAWTRDTLNGDDSLNRLKKKDDIETQVLVSIGDHRNDAVVFFFKSLVEIKSLYSPFLVAMMRLSVLVLNRSTWFVLGPSRIDFWVNEESKPEAAGKTMT